MYRLKFTSSFKKGYKRIQKRGADMSKLDEVVDKLRQGKSLPERNFDHVLKGKFAAFRECHISPDWLLVYLIEDDILTLTLVETGTHADVFKI